MLSKSIFYSVLVLCVSRKGSSGSGLVSQLREDRNLDLSEDEEYEDLRAELLAYHTAFASLAAAQRTDAIGPDEDEAPQPQGRRSLGSTPCWELGGICVKRDLCPKGHRYLTEVRGCRDKFRVCCFTWNQFKLKDMSSMGIKNWAYPWSVHYEFGKNETEEDVGSENKPKRPDEEKDDSEEKKGNKPNDVNSQESQSGDTNDEEPNRRKRRLRKGGNKQPLAIIVKT